MKHIHSILFLLLTLQFNAGEVFAQNTLRLTKNVKLELIKDKAEFVSREILMQSCLDEALIDGLINAANNDPFGSYDDTKILFKLPLLRNTNQIEYKRIFEVNRLIGIKYFFDCKGLLVTENKYNFKVDSDIVKLQKYYNANIEYRSVCLASRDKKEKLDAAIQQLLQSESCSDEILAFVASKYDQVLAPLKNIADNSSQYLNFNLVSIQLNSIQQSGHSIILDVSYTLDIN
ncbi:hypothetical protein FLLO111716_00995 [Flavobacterium longum]|uniref:hypothetical protein n=1 Tax=Flavobacterium longum TaxID=1299340 RepID=UPI0039E7C762